LRQFASSGFRIWNLSREAKLVYSGFLLFSLLALGVSVLFYEDLVGPGSGGVRGYYGGETSASAPSRSPTGGPAMQLPDEPPVRLNVAVTYRKLLEVTHFHLFTVPVFLLIIAHLFMLTAARGKSWWIAGGWLSSLLHLGAPWLVRYGSTAWSFLYPFSGAAMALTLGMMTIYPLVVMWTGGKEANA
jgi:hypothetical protein